MEPWIRTMGVTECRSGWSRSLGLDVGRPDHLAPLLGLVGDQLAEVGGRTRQRRAAHVSELRVDLRIGEGRVDLFVELIDYFDGRVSWCAYAHGEACLIARHKIGHGRDV